MMMMRPRAGVAASTGGSSNAVILDTTRAPTGYVYSESDRKAVNVSGGTNQLRKWAVAATSVSDDGTIRYWEVAVAGGNAQYTGYMGVASSQNRDFGDGGGSYSPTEQGGLGYRGNGDIWVSGNQTVTGGPTWGAGAVIHFAFEPSSGNFWCGANGSWMGPSTPNFDVSSPAASTAPGTFYPFVQGREPDEGGTLLSTADQFVYGAPAGTVPLGAE